MGMRLMSVRLHLNEPDLGSQILIVLIKMVVEAMGANKRFNVSDDLAIDVVSGTDPIEI